MVQGTDKPGLKCWLCHFLVGEPGLGTALSLNVLIPKMGIAVPTSQVCGKIQHVKPVKQGGAQKESSISSSYHYY